MGTDHQPITVTSHVSRDFLQNAAYFNTMPKLIWEYVANSLDAAKEDMPVIVAVDITSNYVTISDNSRGMSRNELRTFFQMHGENIQKKRGKRVRGRFGTGKSAAFGLANYLRIDTTQNGLRNAVELHRKDIEQAENGKPFPVKELIVNESSNEEDGTIVEIKEFNIRHLDVDKVISYIERHLSRYRSRAHVTINGHECKFEEPPFTESFERFPPPEVAQHIGEVSLILKVSPIPLDEDVRGIDILSYGIWHGTTLAGIENKDRANYLFGQMDVPILEDGNWPIPAFDNTRNNTLNPQNPVVAVLLGWLSEELEQLRHVLVEKERERRQSEEAKNLAKEAKKIADILNDDFAQQEMELELARRVSRKPGGKRVGEMLDEQGELWPGKGDIPTPWEQTGHPHGSGKRGDLAGDGDIPRPGPNAQPGNEPGARMATTDGQSKRRRAVFSIDYEHASDVNPRSRYDGETKTIFVNLDHPQITKAYETGGNNPHSRQFREICYEVAVVEYAIALPYEQIEKNPNYEAEVALDDVRNTINRVTRRFMTMLP
jgi:hypothetical protein